MTVKVLIFGAGGALGGSIAEHLEYKKFEIYTAGQTIWQDRKRHIELSYGENFNANRFADFPDFDAVVWAQGLNISDSVGDYRDEDLAKILQSNVIFVASSLKALMAANKVRCKSRLAIVSSIWQIESRPNKFSYTVSKSALQGLIKSAAIDLGPKDILINGVLPGVVDTPMTRMHLSNKQLERIQIISTQTPTRTI